MLLKLILVLFIGLGNSLKASEIKFGIFDISFHGIENLLSSRLAHNYVLTPHDLYSPHGAAVASLIVDPHYGGTSTGVLKLMNTGIYFDDFRRGLELAALHEVRVINISLHLRSKEIVQLLNEHYEKYGTIFVVSAGNNASRTGRSLADYYEGFQGIIVSCIDLTGLLPDFAQIDSKVDFLLPCGRSNILTRIDDLHLGIREYRFGMTSAGAPQLTAQIIEMLSLSSANPSLTEIKQRLTQKARGYFQFESLVLPVIDRDLRIQNFESI
jgi:hypothetical protein